MIRFRICSPNRVDRMSLSARCLLCAICFLLSRECFGQFDSYLLSPLPFPPCRVTDVQCQRRGLRTFFFMMATGYGGMQPIDPIILNSVTVAYPDQQMYISLRNVNVTGAQWMKLAERRFNLPGNRSGVKFIGDLHVTAEVVFISTGRYEPILSFITMDMVDVESNVTYALKTQRGIDNEDYLFIGKERIAVRTYRIPSYFLQPSDRESELIEQALLQRPAILDHISNEIVDSVMQAVVANFRRYAQYIPMRYYYTYY